MNMTPTNEKQSKYMSTSALFASIGASLCCTLPLAATSFGFSLFAGASTFFDTIRPYFLGIAAILLALGFYHAYRKPKASDIDCICDEETELKRKKNFKMMLFVLTALTIGFAFFPQITGMDGNVIGGDSEKTATSLAIIDIGGMTCDGCASSINHALTNLEGVIKADVSYSTKTAIVYFDNENEEIDDIVKKAITDIGFKINKYDRR